LTIRCVNLEVTIFVSL